MNKIRQALERRSLTFKLALGVVSMMLIVLAIGVQSLLVQRSLSEKVKLIHEQGMIGVANVKDIQIYYTQIGRIIRQALLAPDAQERDLALTRLEKARAEISKEIAALRPTILKEAQKQRLSNFEAKYAQFLREVDKASALMAAGRNDDAKALLSSVNFQQTGQATNEILAGLVRSKEESATLIAQEAQREATEGEWLSIAIVVGGLLAGLLFGVGVGHSIRLPLYRIRDAVQQISKSAFNQQLPHTDYPNEIGDLARAIALVQREAQQMETERWVKTHMAEIAGKLQQAQTFTDMAQLFLSSVGPLIKLGHGVFYIYEAEQKRLRLLGSYAFRERKNLEPYFALGQGLVGQCALEMVPMVFTDPPADYVRIGSSLGECVPRTLAVRPVLRNERLLGVVELASFEQFDARQEALLDGLMPILAMNLEILERSGKAQQLLQETQRQATSMEKQAAHLEEQTVEMEAQQKSLKHTTDELERNRLFMEAVLENINSAVYVKDAQGVYTFVNSDWERATGFRRDQVLGRSTLELNHQGRGREYHDSDMAILKGGELVTVEDTVETSSGRKYYQTTKVPMRQGEQVNGICNIAVDITEHKQLEQSMKESEARLRQILENSPVGVSINNEAGVPVFSNRRIAELLGNSPESTGKRNAKESWLRPADREAFLTQMSRDGNVTDYKAEFVHANGTPLTVLLSSKFMELAEGRVLVTWIYDISERERVASALRQSSAEQFAIFETLTHGIALIKDRIILRANSKHAELFDREMSEIEGQSTRVWFADDAEFEQAGVQVYDDLKRGIEHVREQQLQRRDGSLFWCRISARAVDAADLSRGLVCALEDITERRDQEQQLSEAMSLQQAVFDNIPAGVFLTGDGLIRRSNRGLADLLGGTEESFIGQPASAIFPSPEAYAAFGAKVGPLLGQGKSVVEEVNFVRRNGSGFICRVSGSPVSISTYAKSTIWLLEDITERKTAEAAIRESEDRLAMAMQGGNLGLWDWQANPDVLITNDIWSEMLGYSRTEMDAMYPDTAARWANMVWPEDMDFAVDRFVKFVNNEIPEHRMEMRMKTKSGKAKWVLTVGAAAGRDETGKVTRMVGIHQDISERKVAEAEVLRAKEIAEEATKAKSDFLANMSHEIRTPMNAIIGMSHLALQTNLDKKQRNYIEKVHRSGENLLGIINDILDFSKIEAGKMNLETIDFRLEDVMDNLANLVGMKAEDKGIELLFNATADVPTALTGDPLRLGQILINLGNNAVKFTDTGEIVVGIEKVSKNENDSDKGIDLHFWVKDSGIGMTPEQCGKMFQSFSQADASTTRKYGGTGLGLAISKNLVEAMGGRIWVESEAGKGSSFHFHAHFGVQTNPQERRMVKAEELLGVRVLVVDDNASAREILSTMAKTFGLEVEVAWDGQQALSMIAESDKKALPYDLVLMDWKMPVMDGVETVRQLQEEQLSRVPTVIMVTAYGREEAMGSAEQRGVKLSAVLTKPVTASTLLEAIGETLGKGLVVETRSSEKASSHTDVMAQLTGAKVLLVEDNDMNQELAVELLSQAGMQVVLANHGQEALDILAKDSNFDGVLMDCQMPVMDGYTATREIRKNPQFKDLPIIAMTANAMAGDREKVLEAGMWDHIAKPLNVGEMFATIAKWIKPRALGATAVQASTPYNNAAAPPATPVTAIATVTGASAAGAKDKKNMKKPADTNPLAKLPGIDVKAGMATTMDNEKLYTRMLNKFLASQADFAQIFSDARRDADPTAATRAAHTLKGTAGNIGAKGVQAAAGELEHACNDGAPAERIDALFVLVHDALAPVLKGLRVFTGRSTEPANTASIGPNPASAKAHTDTATTRVENDALWQRLEALIRDSDAQASDVLEELQEGAPATLIASLQKVAQALEGYEFDAALLALQKAKSATLLTSTGTSIP